MGLWLVGLNLSAQQANSWPQSLVIAGIVIGVIMALGLVAVPGIFSGIDAWDSAPWYVSYVGVAASGLGWLILYPIWCILLGRML
jgi:protein-S-isoprenylcysteine O-methyltransferase Ste14